MTENVTVTGTSGRSDSTPAKQALRRELRSTRRRRRDRGDAADRERTAQALARHALALPEVEAGHTFTLFEPLDTESDVAVLARQLLARGKRVLVPITLTDLDLSWRDLATGEDLGTGGIALADLVFAPALAVSSRGDRLGQGGGCYDRALPRRRPGVPVIAIVFTDELGVDVPTEAHDEKIDGALTATGVTWFDSGSDGSVREPRT